MQVVVSKIFKFSTAILMSFLCYTATCGQTKTQKIDSLLKVANNLTDIDSSNLLLEKLLKESRANHYTLGTVNALTIQNSNLYNSGNFDEALKFNQSIEEEVLESKEYAKISQLYSLRANCYLNLLFFEKSTQWLNEAQHYADKIKDKDKRYSALGRIYRLRATNIRKNTKIPVNFDSVIYYARKSYNIQRLIIKNDAKTGLIIDSYILGELFFEKENIDSAKKYYTISKAYAKKLNNSKLGQESLIGLASIHEKQNSIDSALFYYNSALKIALKAKRVGNVKKCYQHLAELYNKKGNEDKSQEYAYKFGLITDSIAQANKTASSITADLVIKDNESHYNRNKKQYLIAILGSVAFLIILILVLVKLRKNYKKTLVQQEKEHVALSKKFDSLQMDKLDDEVIKEIVNLVKSNDSTFFTKFKEYHPIFIQKIMHHSPDMLASDLEVCAKLKLGFNTKEIAYYSRSSQRAVESRKYRIRKKLDLKSDDDLSTWVVNL